MEKKYSLRIRVFYKFLKKHKLFEKYLFNLRWQYPNSHGLPQYDMDGDILGLLAVNGNIDQSFTWSRTPEGHRYWEHLDSLEKIEYREYERVIQIMHPIETSNKI